jgi:hypothetical protein
MAKEKVIKCYFCGNVVEKFSELVSKKIPMSTKAGVRNYNRQFHLDCLPKYIEGLEDRELLSEENSDWDNVYKYFRREILGLQETTPLDQHTIKRLLGLRVGTYYPQSTNTRILPRGYSFPVILLTLKVVKAKVLQYISTTNFANNKHRIDGIMRFITSEINDVQKRVDMQKKSNEKLRNDEVKPLFDYTQGLKRKEGKKKIRNGLDD